MDEAFKAVGIKREEVYIANIVKCRPPANRNPEEDECTACMDYLRNQVILVKPEIIVLLRKCCIKTYIRKRIWNNKCKRKLDRKEANKIHANMASSSVIARRVKENRFHKRFKISGSKGVIEYGKYRRKS